MVIFPAVTDLIIGSSSNETNAPIAIVTFTILCDPAPPHLPRPRGNGDHFYVPYVTREKEAVRSLLRPALQELGYDNFPLWGKVEVETNQKCYFQRPPSHVGSRRGVPYVRATAPGRPGTKDTDNMLKFWNDAMETVLYKNDRCVKTGSFAEQYLPLGSPHSYVELTHKILPPPLWNQMH